MAKDYSDIIEAAGKKYNVDPALIRSVIGVETGGQANPNTATSETGAVGLGQLMPSTAKSLGVTDRTDPTQNINGAAKLLDQLLTNSNGNVTLALQRYHGGYDQSDWGQRTAAYPGKVYNQLGNNMKTLPGVPDSHQAPAQQSVQTDDDIFAAFTGAQGGGQTPQTSAPKMSDDDIFKSFTTPSAEQPSATSAPAVQTSANAPAQGGDQYAFGAGGLSNFIDAAGHNAGNAVLGAAQLGMHGLSAAESGLQGIVGGSKVMDEPTSALDKFIQNREQNYQQNVPTNASSVAGAGVGQVLPFLATGGGNLISQGGQLGEKVAGLLGAGPKLTTAGSVAGKGTGSALLGLLASGAQPVNDGGNYMQEKVGQAVTGAALGAVAPAASNALIGGAKSIGNTVGALVRPFTEGGQQKIATNILRQAAGNAPIAAAEASTVPGVLPTLAETSGNPGLAALQRALASRPGNDALSLRQTANQEARNAYTNTITGSADDIAKLQQARDDLTSPMLEKTFANQSAVNPQPVIDTIDAVLNSPGGQRDAISSVMGKIKATLGKVTQQNPSQILDAQGNPITTMTPSASPDALYQSVRKQIGDMLESQNPETRSNVKAVQRELLQVRDSLDNVIEQGAPGFGAYRQAYAEASQPISALRTLQDMNLLGADGTAPVTLNKVRNAIGKVQDAKNNPNSRNLNYQSVSDDQLTSLQNLRDSLLQQQNLNAGQNAVRGSTTAQNLATGSILDAQQPGLVRMLLNGTGRSLTTGGALGGLAGSVLGGPGGAAAGAAIGSQLGGAFGNALRSKAPEVEAKVLDMLLNPDKASAALAPRANRFPLAIGKNINATASATAGAEGGKNPR